MVFGKSENKKTRRQSRGGCGRQNYESTKSIHEGHESILILYLNFVQKIRSISIFRDSTCVIFIYRKLQLITGARGRRERLLRSTFPSPGYTQLYALCVSMADGNCRSTISAVAPLWNSGGAKLARGGRRPQSAPPVDIPRPSRVVEGQLCSI